MPKVSVVIPIYNVERYLAECLESVVNQTLRDIEIICVDDGTKDNSMAIVQRFADADERIVVISKENGGLSSARNAGLEVARGEYVLFLDSDDYIAGDTLEYLYDEAVRNSLDTIFFNADSFYESDALRDKLGKYQEYYHRDGLYEEVVTGQELFRRMYGNNDFRPSACLQMNRTNLLREKGILFTEGVIHEDNLFTLTVSLYSKRAKHVAKSFYQRRVREDSIMSCRNAEKSAEGYYSCLCGIVPLMAEEISDPDVMSEYVRFVKRLVYRNAVNSLRKIPDDEYKTLKYARNTAEDIYYEILIGDTTGWIRDLDVRYQREAQARKEDCDRLNSRIHELETCNSYKVGRIVTYIPRKIKSVVGICRKSGVKGLVKKIIYKVSPSAYRKRFAKVSVVVPVYNGARHLAECMDTLTGQTLFDIDIICVDDGSQDDSVRILNRYAAGDKRIRVYTREHTGAGEARNLGLEKAEGEYIVFLDCDDYFDVRLCDMAYRKAKEKDADIVLYGSQRKNMRTGKTERMGWVLRSAQLPQTDVFSGPDISDRLFQVTTNCPWSKMFKTEYVRREKLKFQNTENANDAFFVRMAMALAGRMTVLDETLVTYRYSDGGNTQSTKDKAPIEFYKAFAAVRDELVKRNIFDRYKASFVNWVLTESMFNYNTVKTEKARKAIQDKLLNEGFENLGVTGCTEDDIYSEKLYNEYQRFIQMGKTL